MRQTPHSADPGWAGPRQELRIDVGWPCCTFRWAGITTSPSMLFLTESSVLRLSANEDTGMLDCGISPCFTADTQISWPGREVGASSSHSCSTCTIKHTAGKHTTAAFLVRAQKEEENPNPGQLFQGIAERLCLSAPHPTLPRPMAAHKDLVARKPKPTVTVKVHSLSLVEGEQHKLLCNIRHYYPHDTQARWLGEPKDSWKVPDGMKNILSSSQQQSSHGTYSSSRYFLLTASLKDDGHKSPCWVDHRRPQAPSGEA
ncbi:uncharacterized protein LJ206_017670 [Theristicus caerulescens]